MIFKSALNEVCKQTTFRNVKRENSLLKSCVSWKVLFQLITVLVTLIDQKMIARLDDIILKHMFKIRRVVDKHQEVADTCNMIPNPAVKCKKILEFAS